jgi:hypothetical protein
MEDCTRVTERLNGSRCDRANDVKGCSCIGDFGCDWECCDQAIEAIFDWSSWWKSNFIFQRDSVYLDRNRSIVRLNIWWARCWILRRQILTDYEGWKRLIVKVTLKEFCKSLRGWVGSVVTGVVLWLCMHVYGKWVGGPNTQGFRTSFNCPERVTMSPTYEQSTWLIKAARSESIYKIHSQWVTINWRNTPISPNQQATSFFH